MKYLKHVDADMILFFIDNNQTKHGKMIQQKPIYSINRLYGADYDYIFVLVKGFSAIVEQLLDSGVPEEKIVTYDRLGEVISIPQEMYAENGERSAEEWTANRKGKKIFICSYDFGRTGVPVALLNLAILLKKMNYHVLMAAVKGESALTYELRINGIDYISNVSDLYRNRNFLEQLKQFDLIILGTLILDEIGRFLSKTNIPIFWWIHESSETFYQDHPLPEKQGNIHYYGGGKRVLRKFAEYYPNEQIEELLYYLPDSRYSPHSHTEVRTFSLLGTWCERKAQDILISAIRELPEDVRKKCIFYFVGTAFGEERKYIESLCEEFSEIRYIYELTQAELAEFYKQIDVLICPSRDDPMPIVVTQALQNGIPCIISDQVGQCEYLVDMEGGTVFQSEDAAALKQLITEFAFCPDFKMEKYSQNARSIFDLYFSETIMKEKIEKILSNLIIF